MKNNQRVLGYCKAKELTKEDLMKISGGGGEKDTFAQTHTATGVYPGNTDFEYDQVWD